MPAKIDLTGQVFGHLEVLETIWKYKNNKTYCKCLCRRCGSICYIPQSNLKSGHTVSCGCLKKETGKLKRKDLVGQKFGQLTVKEMLYNYKGNKVTYCRCVCDCGNEIIVAYDALNKGATKSCGCTRFTNTGKQNRVSIVGERFGRLTITKMLYNYNNTKRCYCKCICDCGNTIIRRRSNIVSGYVTSCGCLKRSHGIETIINLLEENNIDYKLEYRFEDCRGILPLPFDIAVMKNGIVVCLIEYDGKQHFEPVKYFGGQKIFERTQQYDQIKNEYAKSHNIPLIRFNYLNTLEEIATKTKEFIYNYF